MKKLFGIITAKVKTNYLRFTIAILLVKAKAIYDAMLGNKNFPAPTPDMPSLLDLIEALRDTNSKVENGDLGAIADRDAARTDLLNALTSIGNYVNFTSNGNIPMLSSSGYEFYKTKEPVLLEAIKTLMVDSKPNTNALFITVKGGKGIKYFVYEYTTDAKMAEGSWISINSNVRKCVIENLNKGQEYTVRVVYYGSHGQVFTSDPISRIAQ